MNIDDDVVDEESVNNVYDDDNQKPKLVLRASFPTQTSSKGNEHYVSVQRALANGEDVVDEDVAVDNHNKNEIKK